MSVKLGTISEIIFWAHLESTGKGDFCRFRSLHSTVVNGCFGTSAHGNQVRIYVRVGCSEVRTDGGSDGRPAGQRRFAARFAVGQIWLRGVPIPLEIGEAAGLRLGNQSCVSRGSVKQPAELSLVS